MTYGKELILDLHGCNVSLFTREHIRNFLETVCKLINLKPEALYFWDDLNVSKEEAQTNAKTKGTSAIQFILTSNITIHTLDLLKSVYINLFSCEDFDADDIIQFSKSYFQANNSTQTILERT